MLKHEVMAADEWHDNGPQDLVTIPLSIQIAIDQMQLCLLSVAYACPYYNPIVKYKSKLDGEQRSMGWAEWS
jgi:hypothetical protein